MSLARTATSAFGSGALGDGEGDDSAGTASDGASDTAGTEARADPGSGLSSCESPRVSPIATTPAIATMPSPANAAPRRSLTGLAALNAPVADDSVVESDTAAYAALGLNAPNCGDEPIKLPSAIASSPP